jgi:hypothetical protein
MKALVPVVTAMLIFAVMGRLSADDKAPADSALQALDRFAGEWVVDGNWSDGKPLHARSVYSWGLRKKILKAQTFVMDGKHEYQRYEGVLAWHPEKKSLFEISFAFDGSLSEYLIECADKDTFRIGWAPFSPDKPGRVRQVLKFLDNDRFQWVVQVKDGDNWKQIIDATWKRSQ